MRTDIGPWREAARAHGEYFGAVPPASSFAQVVALIEPDRLVEIEADAIVGGAG
jgi:enamine deaminase RidA (YjgF/YER057c/UK114 family)